VAQARSRTYTWEDPLEVLGMASELSGLEALRRTIAGELPHPPIAETLGLRLVEADPGRVVWEGEPGEQHYNPLGTVHAGFATTLLDSAMGCAFISTAPPQTAWTTLELKANFTRAITAQTGRVRCTGTVVHPGRTVATTEARLEDELGRLLAHGTSTILVLGEREQNVAP
jgi:uncharacterized protein (TIGR00369 family)